MSQTKYSTRPSAYTGRVGDLEQIPKFPDVPASTEYVSWMSADSVVFKLVVLDVSGVSFGTRCISRTHINELHTHRVVVLIFGGIFLTRSVSRSVSRQVILPERLCPGCRDTKNARLHPFLSLQHITAV